MLISSRWSCDIPKCSLTTYLFGSPTVPLPKKPLYIDALNPEKSVPPHAYRSLVQRIASGFLAPGLRPGDRALLYSANSIFFPSVLNGVIAAGGVFTGADPSFTPRELEQQIRSSGVRFLVAHRSKSVVAREAAGNVGLDEGSVFLLDEGLDVAPYGSVLGWADRSSVGGTRHWSDIIENGYNGFVWRDLKTDEELDTTVGVNYSSGTTGIPKGVQISHKNFVSNAHQVIHILKQSSTPSGESRWLGVLPMYHAFGQTHFAIITPKLRIPLYMLSKYDSDALLTAVQRHKITIISAVPPIMVALAEHPDVLKFDLSSLNKLRSGSAPATCAVTNFHPDDTDEGCSVGELLPNCEGKVMDAETTTRELLANTPGEAWIRAPNITKGYFRDEAATKETITPDGWLKTGDIGYYNNAGRWFIIDRKKELIKVKGNQVAPAELEGLLLEHPGVADAAVIGISHAKDERPRAYNVPKPNVALAANEICDWVKQRAIRYKWITGGVVFVTVVPRNMSGKILRRELRDGAKTEIADSGEVPAKL